jgi:hypothetical protein
MLTCAPGCAVLTSGQADVSQLAGVGADLEGQMAGQPAATVTLQIQPAGKQAESQQITLTESMRIQTVLEQTKLVRRFKRMNLYVMRSDGQQRQKMESKYMHKKGMVNPLYDYSLRPGDHLVVVEDTRDMFDDMFDSLGGPFARTFQR